ncbi:MAG: prenyltransferase/squalene oxidase repeat-containing protein [Gemmataceae bacterium]
MSKPNANAAGNAALNFPGPRKMIVAPHVDHYGPTVAKFLVVWACSLLINLTLLGGATVVFPMLGSAAGGEAEVQPAVEETTEVVDNQKEYDLTNTDLGMDDSVPLNYNVDRIEEVSVPGKVDPTAAVGIVNAPEAAPSNVPPPPGSGGGTGGAVFDPNVSGVGMAGGSLGGMGGMYNPGGFGGRSGSTREKSLREGGGNARSEKAVADGLKFLALHQSSDGRWSLNNFNRNARTEPLPGGKVVPDNSQPMTTRSNDTAGTAFGLLPFLAGGITHKPAKDKKQKDYSKGVGKAIDFLIAKQSKSGADRGFYGGDMYSHGLATIAMCEAYGLTSDPRIKASAQLGLNYIVNAQDPAGGGWRYTPKTAGDTSVTGWQLMALKSGQMAGLSVPRQVLKKVEQFLDSVESSKKGGYAYVPGSDETVTMTAVGALCRQYLGVNPRNPSLLGSVKRVQAAPPAAAADNVYYIYYATQVMHHMGGDAWNFWNLGPDGTGKGGIRDTLIAKQDQGQGNRPGQAGSFAGNDHVGGRLGATSLCLLSLEVYYRHLPLYRRDANVMKNDADK